MLKLLLTIGCALLLPLLSAPAAAQASPVGIHGFIVDSALPAVVQPCRPKEKFLCLHLLEENWNGVKGDTLVSYANPQPDEFLGSSVSLMVVHKRKKVRIVAATTRGASEQRRILAELTKRYGKPEQVVERNIRLTASGPKHAYLMARWDLPGGEVCFHGVLPPEKNAKEPARQGRIYYSSRSLRGTTNCILSL